MYGFVHDSGVSEALRKFGEYASVEIGLYRSLLAPDDAFVDVGCNIGVFARAIATMPSAPTVIGFEPQPESYRLAVANTIKNENVTMFQLAAYDSTGSVLVDEIDTRSPGNYGAAQVRERDVSHVTVPCASVRLDTFLSSRVPCPRLIKIDVEGSEVAVLRGLDGLLHERLVISVEADRRNQVPLILGELQRLGCTCYAFFAKVISAMNPRYDLAQRHCRIRHVHLLAFVGEPSPWVLQEKGFWPIGSVEDFDTIWNLYFAATEIIGAVALG